MTLQAMFIICSCSFLFIQDGDYGKVEQMLVRRASDVFIDIDCKDKRTGNTALIWAAKKGHNKVIFFFLAIITSFVFFWVDFFFYDQDSFLLLIIHTLLFIYSYHIYYYHSHQRVLMDFYESRGKFNLLGRACTLLGHLTKKISP